LNSVLPEDLSAVHRPNVRGAAGNSSAIRTLGIVCALATRVHPRLDAMCPRIAGRTRSLPGWAIPKFEQATTNA